MMFPASALLLLLLQTDPSDAAPALVPESAIRATDDRPLLLIQQEFLASVIDVESRASALEGSLPEVAGDAERADRVARDSALMTQMSASLRVQPDLRPLALSRGVLPAIDRYLLGFALERLRSREVVPIADLEQWRAENVSFLESRDLASRDRALLLRERVLKSMTASSQLAALVKRFDTGPLSEEERQAQIAMLQNLFPDAPLPAGQLAAGGAAGAPGAAEEPGPDSLPRLDGVEIPRLQLPDVGAPTAADIAGANALALQMMQAQLAGAPKVYRPNVPPPRKAPKGRGPQPRGRYRFALGY